VALLLLVGNGAARPDNVYSANLLTRTIVQPVHDEGASQPQPVPSPPSPADPPARFSAGPHLETAEPTGDGVPVNAAIVATFSQRMDHASVERSFAIGPQVSGQLAWVDDFSIRFQPDRLLHGVAYKVTIGGRSARGMRLTGSGGWHFTTVPGPPLVLAADPAGVRVPILMYHYVRVVTDRSDRMGFALSVTPSDFADQMEWLAHNGFHTITLEDLNAYLGGERGLPARPVILTFDDGYADFYTTALPILRSHDFTAVAYVVSGFIGRSGYMTAAQVEAADRAGIEIGSHTVDHANLTTQSSINLSYQLSASKQALEQLLGHPVLSFCYPSGRFNARVVAAVRAAGYRDATTTMFRFVRTQKERYIWGRLRITGGESLGQFGVALLSAS
jgi:peptidoglycan/xylan/chitin deacetylase (PgdA/CDA1 family)